jgi:signal transduction histidine kinase
MPDSRRGFQGWSWQGRRERVTHSRSGGRAEFTAGRELDEELLDDLERSQEEEEERELQERRLHAEEKLQFYMDAGKRGLLTLALLIFIPPVGVIFGIIWGIHFGRDFFGYVVEPRLRDRLVGVDGGEVVERVRHSMQTDRQALEGEHAQSLEKLSASIAHEIRNPITAAKSLVQQMSEDPRGRDNPEYAKVALAELERVERSISHLLRFARDEELRSVEVRMADVLDSAIETFRDRRARTGISIEREFDCAGLLCGDPEKLRRVAINLLSNAFDALEEAGTRHAHIEVAMGENLAGTEVWVRVRDNGSGMDAGLRERAFSPFVTSKAAGTGLGLAITKKIIESHDGVIEIESEAGRGTEFIVTLPKERRSAGGRL